MKPEEKADLMVEAKVAVKRLLVDCCEGDSNADSVAV
jgi:hypothetical protein